MYLQGLAEINRNLGKPKVRYNVGELDADRRIILK